MRRRLALRGGLCVISAGIVSISTSKTKLPTTLGEASRHLCSLRCWKLRSTWPAWRGFRPEMREEKCCLFCGRHSQITRNSGPLELLVDRWCEETPRVFASICEYCRNLLLLETFSSR